MKTSCVILNYNDAQTVIEQVKRIYQYSSLDYIVVVDNCSTDNSWEELQALKEKSEKISLIQTEKNGGYGAGNNAGTVSYTHL